MTSVSTDRRFGVNIGAAVKVPCQAATTANITLSGEQTVDGVALVTGNRCLVKNQTSGVNNGIYTVDTGTWTRSPDFDGTYDAKKGTFVYITGGTVSAALFYTLTTSDPITIGTTSLAFSVISPSSPLSLPLSLANGGTAATSAISALSSLGVIQVTAEAGTANAQTGTVDALVTALRADQLFIFVPSVANTGATTLTLTPSGSGPLAGKSIFANGAALKGNELVASMPTLLQYDGTQFQIIGPMTQQNGSPTWVASAGTVDAITATYAPAIAVLLDGMILGFRATGANTTTTPSFAPNGLTARTIVKRGGSALVAGDIAASLSEYLVRYNLANTRWELLNPTYQAFLPSAAQTFLLTADVALNNTGNYFNVVNTGSIGAAGQVWKIRGAVCLTDTAGSANFLVRIWDTSTIYVETEDTIAVANHFRVVFVEAVVTLAGAATFHISCKDLTSTSGLAKTTAGAGTANKATWIIAERIS